MKRIANKVDAKRYVYSGVIIFIASVLTIAQLVAFTGIQWFLFLLPLMLPIIGISSIMQWNFDFTNATFKEKRKMADALNNGMD